MRKVHKISSLAKLLFYTNSAHCKMTKLREKQVFQSRNECHNKLFVRLQQILFTKPVDFIFKRTCQTIYYVVCKEINKKFPQTNFKKSEIKKAGTSHRVPYSNTNISIKQHSKYLIAISITSFISFHIRFISSPPFFPTGNRTLSGNSVPKGWKTILRCLVLCDRGQFSRRMLSKSHHL